MSPGWDQGPPAGSSGPAGLAKLWADFGQFLVFPKLTKKLAKQDMLRAGWLDSGRNEKFLLGKAKNFIPAEPSP